MLYQRIDEQRAFVDCTQRAVARGRRAIVESHRRARLGGDVSPGSSPAPLSTRPTGLAALARRLEGIHQRLLLFSSLVECEMDRLDITSEEIDRMCPEAGAECVRPASTGAPAERS